MAKQGLICELSLAWHPRVRARAAAAQLGIWGGQKGGWLLKRAVRAPKRSSRLGGSTRGLRASGHCTDCRRGRVGVGKLRLGGGKTAFGRGKTAPGTGKTAFGTGKLPSGEKGMAGALPAAPGGARDGHKLGECPTPFCIP